jgi:hypothetical protein
MNALKKKLDSVEKSELNQREDDLKTLSRRF